MHTQANYASWNHPGSLKIATNLESITYATIFLLSKLLRYSRLPHAGSPWRGAAAHV
jgi:hypothetical protein